MFDVNQFQQLLVKRNAVVFNKFSTFSQKSSLDVVLKELAGVRGFIPPHKKKIVQNVIFNLPHDKHVKYAEALRYLSNAGIFICGKPVNPVMEFVRFDAGPFLYTGVTSDGKQILNSTHPRSIPVHSFHHVFDFKFKSSTGNLDDLKNVGTREHVKFRVQPGSPPFNSYMADTPIEFHWGVNKTGANTGFGRDDHMTKPPSLIVKFPVTAGELVADQWYQYTIDNGLTWENIEGAAYNLIKGVRKGANGKWCFYFIKKNWAPHNNVPFHFEVEYDIHPPMPPVAPGSPLGKANGTAADISKYGRALRLK